ncbi:CybS-domain-containing protein [Apodospora peruviana]|uniref:Succinate dehydrogenase [ubiquinone] cytochrome b small subunit n=1 Tax=Apodospora peruviana TaxID=516989 RepID=A0AAE0IQU9_9PEZI|nr:CybS-domain-containing protein [Apodospora peruviana]
MADISDAVIGPLVFPIAEGPSDQAQGSSATIFVHVPVTARSTNDAADDDEEAALESNPQLIAADSTTITMASIARSVLPTQATAASRLSAVAARPIVNNAVRTTAFHTTSRRDLLPPLPQRVDGTVNDPAPIPPTSPSHGSYHWTFDRLLAGALVPLTVAPFAAGSLNPTMDAVLCAAILIHSHTGFQNIIIDYVPQKRMPRTRKAFMWGLNAATAVVGLALYEFETTDVGLTETVKRIWTA